MGYGATLIRLIDVVFILLFGFISISEVNQKSKVVLPESTETPASSPDREKVLFVGITADGRYLLEDETMSASSSKELFVYLQNKVASAIEHGSDLRVRIRSNWNTPIKYTMAAADICDHLNIQKGIDVRRTSAGAN